MKKFLILFLILVIVGFGGFFGWKKFNEFQDKKHRANAKNEKFVWGVTTRPHAINKYTPKEWTRTVTLAKDLGVNYVRVGWEADSMINGKVDPIGFNDKIISEIEKQKMGVYLVFGDNPKITKYSDPYYEGYNEAFQIASHFKGRIKYYQLANEISSEALKGGQFSGDKPEHFDEAKYEKVREWLKGASAGIKKADPDAYRVVVGQWIQYGFFGKIQEDQVDYDVIGWDWFSDMNLMKDNKLDDGTSIVDQLKKFDKPIMLVEVNQRPEGENGKDGPNEEKQSKYIKDMADWAYNSGVIKGFIVLELTDLPNFGKEGYIDRYGLVKADRNASGRGVIVGPRKAYETYKGIISKYSK